MMQHLTDDELDLLEQLLSGVCHQRDMRVLARSKAHHSIWAKVRALRAAWERPPAWAGEAALRGDG